ncbi:hypothetical protein ABZ370_08255 [Streptomyces sp. NPDC005962]|uniref:hypothetical protein n=1 Tax=Streptomyces sp. NPDC005962 TaxID=3154466 RepID=UPI0033F0E16F
MPELDARRIAELAKERPRVLPRAASTAPREAREVLERQALLYPRGGGPNEQRREGC